MAATLNWFVGLMKGFFCVLGWSYKFMYRQSMYYITIPMSPQEPEDNVFTPLLSAQVRINK